MNSISNKKRIVHNTFLLYLRMFFTMAVGLYTSRVVLNVLGVSDYGVYNLVGGMVTIVAFLNSSMISATQRFISYEMGRNDYVRLNKIFCTSVNIYLVICAIVVILGETVGLWFVNTRLIISPDRMIAANWVYQLSILSFIITVLNIPYNSVIVAHEDMSVFAYISIIEVVLKLLVVYMLIVIPLDKLIVYAILIFLVGLTVRFCYTAYCHHKYKECDYHFLYDRKIFREMFVFAGWSIFGNLGFSFKDQISNILLNLFYGTTLNAARGVAIQVSTIVSSFVNNFTMALNPQITKQYAAGNTNESINLVYVGSRMSFHLLSIISIPLLVNIEIILKMWLGVVPQYTEFFVFYSLLTALLYALSGCVTTAIQATGRMKWFQMGICIIMLSELPIAWMLLKIGSPPYSVMWPSVVTFSIAIIYRFYLINRYVVGYSIKEYYLNVVFRCSITFAISYLLSHRFFSLCEINLVMLIVNSLLCIFLVSIVTFIVGITKNEKKMIATFVFYKIMRKDR